MGNQFFGFSPESFEQFTRALSVLVFGPGVRAFGNGPDGGREATFLGEVPYPYPPASHWTGYGVIQAKCKEKSESTQRDQDWALRLLTDELEAFVNSEKRHPKPEYYVFVTNVEFSSVVGGGKDRAENLIQSYYGRLPLKGHAVWDANQLTALLAVHEELRRRFREFLTTGDILSAMLTEIERHRPNTTRILSMFLERELRADEASRLDQAGNRTDDQLRLAQLFFDLPASTHPQVVAPKETVDAAGRLPHGVLWEMLHAGSCKLDPKTLYDQETSSSEGEDVQFPARFVLLGGPGSGKSTLGQFLAQIHRAALLMRREPYLLEPQTRRIIEETRQLCEREGLPWPTTPRYPFRVELNRFAKRLTSLKQCQVSTLAGYLLSGMRSEDTLNHEVFLEWIATYPSLLILDGLDEVPATSNREEVIKTVDDFLSVARQMGADIFVVGTSRHQGYAGEFAGGVVAIRHILPLSTPRALRYVESYANARFGVSNPQKAKEIITRLNESSRRQLTAELMGSPLQVTFMATVVAARGDPGEDRWQLFDSYYRTIYDRERQKAVPPYDTVLSKQQPTIDRLHHDIGFWLQYRGETTGGTAATLTIDLFERLVDSYLAEIGRDDPDKQHLVALITEAARHRLVFLTSRVAGELSFDVRSLQEYMAAECLTSGDPELVQSRLRAIAPAPYWRNVFLFAVSKCFADTRSRHLQDSIRVLCEDLNSPSDRLLAATKTGSELALDILQSGAVAENPNYSRHLARIGLALLQQPYLSNDREEGPSAERRLAAVYRDFLENVYREEIELRIGQSEVKRTLGTWPLLLRLCQEGIHWAEDLLQSHWPSDVSRLMVLAPVFSNAAQVPFARRRLENFLPTLSPSKALSFLQFFTLDQESSDLFGALLSLRRHRGSEITIPLRIPGVKHDGCRFRLVSIRQTDSKARDTYAALSGMKQHHPGWLPFVLAANFLESPNRGTLARILDQCAAGGWEPDDKAFLWSLPWPLSLALDSAESGDELRSTANLLRKPAVSAAQDWAATEDVWSSEGITLDQVMECARQPGPLDILLGSRGFPSTGALSIIGGGYPDSSIRTLYQAALKAHPGEFKSALVWFLCLAGTYNARFVECVEPSQLRVLLSYKDKRRFSWQENCVRRPERLKKEAKWLEFFDWLGRSDILSPFYREGSHGAKTQDDDWCEAFQDAFIRGGTRERLLSVFSKAHHPVRLGLLRLLGRLASTGKTMEQIPPQMLNLSLFPEPRFKLAALLVRIAQRNLKADEARQLAREAVALLAPPAEGYADGLLFGTIDSHVAGNEGLSEFLLELRERIPMEMHLGTASCEKRLRWIVRGRSSSLQSPELLRKLRLPAMPETSRIAECFGKPSKP